MLSLYSIYVTTCASTSRIWKNVSGNGFKVERNKRSFDSCTDYNM